MKHQRAGRFPAPRAIEPISGEPRRQVLPLELGAMARRTLLAVGYSAGCRLRPGERRRLRLDRLIQEERA
jgi:hypothetical protein